jgi:ATP-dependent helicase/DNAse subunit B
MSKPLRLLARRPLCYPGFTRKLFFDLGIAERFKPQDILYLTPNKRRARSAEFEILSLYPGTVLQPPTCLTIQTLAESLVTTYSTKGIVDERDRRFILLKLVHESKDLPFREEHLGLLSNLYAELRRYHPEDWQKIPAASREVIFDMDTAARLAKAVELLEKYDNHLAEEGLIDHEAVLAEACSFVAFLSHKLLIVEGYFEPWKAEQRLFDELLQHIHQVVVIIPDDPLAAKGEEFFSRYDLSQRPTPKPLPFPEFTWQRFPSREDEVVAIARRICALAEAGVYSKDIIVVFPALRTYGPIVERVFARYGLNPSVAIHPRLESFPGIQVILDLLRAAERKFRRRNVVGLLLSPAFKNVPESVRCWIDALSRDEGVISGQKAWIDSFLADIPWKLKDYPQAAKIRLEIRGFLKRFIRQLKLLSEPVSIQEFTQRLKSTLNWLGWEVEEVLQRGLSEAVEKFARMAELSGQMELAPSFARETLEVLLRKEIPSPEDEPSDAIRVMPLVESRWLDARYLFIGGLVDGEFPKRPYRDLLLPERLRQALRLPTAQDDFANAEFEFRRLLSMAREHVFLSAASMEDDRPLLPAVFLAEEEESPKVEDPIVYCEEEQQLLEPRDRGEQQEGVMFTDPASLGLIGASFGPTHPFRVTLLEVYRTCPYRYYLRSVVGLEPYEEPTAEPEARLLGTIMHSVLERLFKADPDPERIDELLWGELINELDRRRLNPFLRLWIEDWVRARKDWFRDQETARAEAGWQVDPSWLEKPLELFFKKEGFSLKGRVDRVDWQERRARVLDYKTGKERDFKRKIEKGESIQLPLYCEMIRRFQAADVASFGLYNLLDAKLDEIAHPESQMLAALGFVQEAVAGIRGGLFPLQDSQVCRYCEYREFCEAR